jgi:hypothetical protein
LTEKLEEDPAEAPAKKGTGACGEEGPGRRGSPAEEAVFSADRLLRAAGVLAARTSGVATLSWGASGRLKPKPKPTSSVRTAVVGLTSTIEETLGARARATGHGAAASPPPAALAPQTGWPNTTTLVARDDASSVGSDVATTGASALLGCGSADAAAVGGVGAGAGGAAAGGGATSACCSGGAGCVGSETTGAATGSGVGSLAGGGVATGAGVASLAGGGVATAAVAGLAQVDAGGSGVGAALVEPAGAPADVHADVPFAGAVGASAFATAGLLCAAVVAAPAGPVVGMPGPPSVAAVGDGATDGVVGRVADERAHVADDGVVGVVQAAVLAALGAAGAGAAGAGSVRAGSVGADSIGAGSVGTGGGGG